jgi:hypothetical protein
MVDTTPYEEPILDGPLGKVIILQPYDPVNRCWAGPPTAVGHPDDLAPDGALVCSGTGERCYARTDGIVFYSSTNCIHGGNFLFNVDDQPYSDLGPCEPPKHLDISLIKDCPVPSCVFARDVLVDVGKGCAEAIDSRGCRDVVGAPTSCFCDPSSSNRVFVAYDGKSTMNEPSGFVACDASNPSCKSALAIVDTVSGCATSVDAGDAGDTAPETPTDATVDAASDSASDG